ncbi:GH1 family beta-glucosidase [Nonomuraea sp. CA-143628]|uniref:GH1 family beta-glucosidase n=1 Tax=Nonomuraea sp. CA-143628 TaxID=3239997 RepID=UPI003D8F9FF4
MSTITFPQGFLWGAATAAYQVEGAVAEDGRTASIWDTFSHTPGRVLDGDTGDVACDHYHRYADDVALMARLGLGAYRFSVSWPRVQPGGRGRANQRGLDFYRRLTDELLERGIEPWVTLYHWDLPQELEDAGGWPARDTAARFAEYAALVHEALGDRVRHWITLNEPWCAAFLGYAHGRHAPGGSDAAAALAACHHMLLGHGLATRAIRSADSAAVIGTTLNVQSLIAHSDSPADREALRRVDGIGNRIFLDPLLRAEYPADVATDIAHLTDLSFIHPGDLATIAAPIDFLGLNYYNPLVVAASVDGQPSAGPAWPGCADVSFIRRGFPVTHMGWEIDPAGLTALLRRVTEDYGPIPLYITENGAAYADTVDADGGVHDQDRIDYFARHLHACLEAIRAGVPLQGYFAWSLMDNFEWGWGYSRRFGLLHVDYATQRRTIKDSGHWYAEVIRRSSLQ